MQSLVQPRPALLCQLRQGSKQRESVLTRRTRHVAAYRENVLPGFQQAEDNLAAVRILENEAKVQDEAVVAAWRSLDLSIKRYKGWVTSYLEVITAQNAALTDEVTAVNILGRRMANTVLLILVLVADGPFKSAGATGMLGLACEHQFQLTGRVLSCERIGELIQVGAGSNKSRPHTVLVDRASEEFAKQIAGGRYLTAPGTSLLFAL